MTSDLKAILESLLFVSDEPLPLSRMQQIVEIDDPAPVRAALAELAELYTVRGGGFFLETVAGGYQLRSRPEFKHYIQRMLQSGPARLSKAALETLAIVAYKQPVLRADIEHIRGVDSGGVLRILMERDLIRILGRKEIPGRPLIYGTTRRFLEVFGLRDLKDLPIPKEIGPSEDLLTAHAPRSGPGEEASAAAEGEVGRKSAEPVVDDAGDAPPDPPNEPDSASGSPVLTGRAFEPAGTIDPRYGIYTREAEATGPGDADSEIDAGAGDRIAPSVDEGAGAEKAASDTAAAKPQKNS